MILWLSVQGWGDQDDEAVQLGVKLKRQEELKMNGMNTDVSQFFTLSEVHLQRLYTRFISLKFWMPLV